MSSTPASTRNPCSTSNCSTSLTRPSVLQPGPSAVPLVRHVSINQVDLVFPVDVVVTARHDRDFRIVVERDFLFPVGQPVVERPDGEAALVDVLPKFGEHLGNRLEGIHF